MPERTLRRIAFLPLLAATFALLFRMLVWQSWGPVAGEPYGASDLIEVLLFVLTTLCAMVALAAAVWVLARRHRSPRLAWLLGLAAVAGPALHWYLQPLVPTFRLW